MSKLVSSFLKFRFWKKDKTCYWLVFIFILAVALRIVGTNPGYPLTHPDESTIVDATRKIVLHFDLKPTNYYYGSLLPFIYAAVDLVFFAPLLFRLSFIISLFDITKINVFDYFSDLINTKWDSFDTLHNYFGYWARYETAFLSACTVLIIYLLGKKLFNKYVGLIWAFLVAVNYRNVMSSRFALADAPAAFFAALSLLLILNLIKKPNLRNYFLAGIGLGLAFSVKYFIYTIPTFLFAHFYIIFSGKLSISAKLKNIFSKRFLISSAAAVALFLIINPFLIFDSKEAQWQLTYNAKRYGLSDPHNLLLNLIHGVNAYLSLIPIRYLLWYGLGYVLTISIVLGYLYALIRHFRQTFFISTLVFPFLFVFIVLSKESAFVRNYASITPFLLFFPAVLIFDASKRIRKKEVSFIIMVVLCFIVSFESFRDSILTSYYFSMPQNVFVAREWLNKNLSNKNGLVLAATTDSPSFSAAKIVKTFDIFSRGVVQNMSIDELTSDHVEYAVLDSTLTSLGNAELWAENKDLIEEFFDKQKMAQFLKNSYIGLSLQELGDYRIKEFVKPFWQSNEAAYFVVKIPHFKEEGGKLIKTYGFSSESSENLQISSFIPCNLYLLKKTKGVVSDLSSIEIEGDHSEKTREDCSVETQFTEKENFTVEQNKFYSVNAVLKRETANKDSTNGFIRLDFYSSSNQIIKTYISAQLSGINDWQNLRAWGFAPEGSKYAHISFQLDKYNEGEQYFIESFKVFLDEDAKLDLSGYPYYGKPIPQNFYWLLEL